MPDLSKRRFDDALARMRARNPQTAEDAFGELAALAGAHVGDLIEAYDREARRDMRCWLLELIGSARSDQALELLRREARSDDDALMRWAVWGLKELNTPEARGFLFENGLRD